MLDVSFKACAALGEARGSEFPLDVGALSWQWGLWQDRLSRLPHCGFSLICLVYWCHSASFGFFFFLKEIVLYVTADPVYPCVWFAILN